LGDRFRLIDFHEATLGAGMVPLDVLEQVLGAYIAENIPAWDPELPPAVQPRIETLRR